MLATFLLFIPFSYWSFVSPKSTSCKLQLVDQNTPKWTCSGGTQLRTQVDLGSQSRTQFEEEALKSPQLSSAYWQWPSSCSLQRRDFATATLRFRLVWVDTDCWLAFFVDDTGVNQQQTLVPIAFAVRVSCLLQLCMKSMRCSYLTWVNNAWVDNEAMFNLSKNMT